ncbi:MAG: MMPL family transporter [Actinomycetota bacterium]
MDRFWRQLGWQLGEKWKIVTAVMVAVTVVLGAVGLPQVNFATGQDSYLNPESQIAIDNVAFQDSFGGETVILLFSAEEGNDVADLFAGDNLATLQSVTDELRGVDDVHAVVTPYVSLQFSDNLLGGGVGTSALLSASGRDDGNPELRQADISTAIARLGSVAADERVIGNVAYNDLLIFGNEGFEGAEPPARDELQIRRSLRSTFPNVEGLAPNSTAVGGVVLVGNADLDQQSAATDEILAILDDVELDGFELTITGSPVYLQEINDYLQGGMVTLGIAALIVMAVVLGLIFQVRWRLLPLLAVLIGVIWAFSIVALLGIDLSLVTISGLPILIGLGIDFAIQIHNRVEEEVVLDNDTNPISETMRNVAPPLIVAVIAAVVAFLALQISLVPMIRDFGILLSIGVLSLLVTGIVLPGMILGVREWTGRTKERDESRVEKVVVKLGGLPVTSAPILIVVSAALFVGGVFAEGSAKIQSDPLRWIDQGSEVVTDINRLEDETGFSTTLGILVSANNVYEQDVIDLIHEFTVAAETRPDGAVLSSSSLVNTMGKIIKVADDDGDLVPTTADVVAAAEVMPPDIAAVLVDDSGSPLDATSTQLNLRIAPASLEERADIVAELEADLEARIAALGAEIETDSILLQDIPEGQDPVRATPAGLATVGIGLLENLSANRANLTYLSLLVVGVWLVVRFRSLSRSILALTPVLLAVGVSSLVVGLAGIELSPLTTVGGPLVIATCAEFSVLILGRYLEERQSGLEPEPASERAARRTGRAFFTSAMTTVGGFAVLIGSALPLLRDFGLVVTLNVAIALLAALVVMPPLSMWVDRRGWLGLDEQADLPDGVVLAAPVPGGQTAGAVVGGIAMVAGSVAVYAAAETEEGKASEISFLATQLTTSTLPPLTTTTAAPTTTTEAPAEEEPADDGEGEEAVETTTTTTEAAGPEIDPSGFPSDPPGADADIAAGALFPVLVGAGVEPNVANCAISTLLEETNGTELIAAGILQGTPEAIDPVQRAAFACGITPEQFDAALTAFLGG